jgi:hypothetical protein
VAELSDREKDYLLVACIVAEGPRRQVNIAQKDLAEEVGIRSEEERIVQLSLCDAWLISLAPGVYTGIFELTIAGKRYGE